MTNLDDLLKCKEHEAPYLICTLQAKRGKTKINCEFRVICPVDQKLEKILGEFSIEELENLYFPIADKIFRCEKCFGETTIQETIIEKAKVNLFLSCAQHGRLITREIGLEVYDKIRSTWDMKNVRKDVERTY